MPQPTFDSQTLTVKLQETVDDLYDKLPEQGPEGELCVLSRIGALLDFAESRGLQLKAPRYNRAA